MTSTIPAAQQVIDQVFSNAAYPQVALQCGTPDSGYLSHEQFEALTATLTQRILDQLTYPDDQVKIYVDTMVQGNVKSNYTVALSDEQRTPPAAFFPAIISAILKMMSF